MRLQFLQAWLLCRDVYVPRCGLLRARQTRPRLCRCITFYYRAAEPAWPPPALAAWTPHAAAARTHRVADLLLACMGDATLATDTSLITEPVPASAASESAVNRAPVPRLAHPEGSRLIGTSEHQRACSSLGGAEAGQWANVGSAKCTEVTGPARPGAQPSIHEQPARARPSPGRHDYHHHHACRGTRSRMISCYSIRYLPGRPDGRIHTRPSNRAAASRKAASPSVPGATTWQ